MKRQNFYSSYSNNSNSDNSVYRNRSMRNAQRSFLAQQNNNKASQSSYSPNSNYQTQSSANSQYNVQYIPYDRRGNYNSNNFYGDERQHWTTQNTAGWESHDLSNPNNPNSPYYRQPSQNRNLQSQPQPAYHHHKHHVFAWVIIILLVIGFGWIYSGIHNANNQSTQPQKPRIIRKTIIDHTPRQNNSQNSNTNPNDNNDINQNNNTEAEKLQADMQNAKINSQKQQQLLNLFAKQNAQNQQRIFKYANYAEHLIPTNALKRQLINYVMNQFGD